MVWNPAIPATNADLISAPVRDNFGALDTALMAALATLANGQVLTKAAGPVVAGVPAGTNGHVLTLASGAPVWQAAPGVSFPLLAPDGTVAAPSYSFASATGIGLSRTQWLAPNGTPSAPGYSFATNPGCGMLEDTGNFVLRATAVVGLTANGRVDASWMVYTSNEWMPGADNAFDIGHANYRPRDLWLSRLTDYTGLAAAPATPAAGHVVMYAKTDKKLYQKDDAGLETVLGGGGGMTNPMTTTGDLIVGGSAGTPGRFAAVATGAVLASAGVGAAPTWNIAPTVTGLTVSGLTAGSVVFAGTSGVLSQDNANLFFDDTNNNLRLFGGGVGTSGQGVLALGPGTAPTTSPVDTVQLFTVDVSAEAGSRALRIRDERGGIYEFGSKADNTTGLYIGASKEILLGVDPTQAYLMTAPSGGHTYYLQTTGTGSGAGAGAWLIYDGTAGKTRLQWDVSGSLLLCLNNQPAKYVTATGPDSAGAGYRYLIIGN
jgi:hypothetical protein